MFSPPSRGNALEQRLRINEPWVSIANHPLASSPIANIVNNLGSKACPVEKPTGARLRG
jgi:hypothetical protein